MTNDDTLWDSATSDLQYNWNELALSMGEYDYKLFWTLKYAKKLKFTFLLTIYEICTSWVHTWKNTILILKI